MVGVLAVLAAGGAAPAIASGTCPPDMPGGCKGFLSGKRLALTAVLGTGLDAMPDAGRRRDARREDGLRVARGRRARRLGSRHGKLRRVAIARFIALDPRGRWAIAPQPRKGIPDRDWDERGSGLEIWDLTTRRRVATAKAEWEHPLEFVFSSRRVLVWGFLDGDYGGWVWDTATGKVRRRGFGFCGLAAVTPDGKHALCSGGGFGGGDDDDEEQAGGDDGVALWDLDRQKIVRRMPARALREGRVAGLALSADGGKGLVILSQGRHSDHTSVVWNLATGQTSKGPRWASGPAPRFAGLPTRAE